MALDNYWYSDGTEEIRIDLQGWEKVGTWTIGMRKKGQKKSERSNFTPEQKVKF
jgi:hypothetical protein